jgi:hypothetical protein
MSTMTPPRTDVAARVGHPQAAGTAPPTRKNALVESPRRTATRAAMAGRISVLAQMEATGMEWRHPDVCAAAAMKGHLHVLKWARKHGCAWDDRVCDLSDANGWEHVRYWADQNGCP